MDIGNIKKPRARFSGIFKKNRVKVAVILFVFLTMVSLIFVFFRKDKPATNVPAVPREYAQTFSLTSDKISQSANIAISLPPNSNLSVEEARDKVQIYPEVKGKWVQADKKDLIVFNPDENMKIGRYYTVTLSTSEGTIGNDFFVVDDPKVLNVFPKRDSETNEDSEITILFNRPMVPLSTLDVMSQAPIPVEIGPETKGKFKWIGTRTLQFIPENNLIRSSNYYVRVKPEFVSLDGLGMNGFEHKFKTRPLRYISVTSGVTIYDNPIAVNFNQDVDLERTMKEMMLVNTSTNKPVAFTAEYGQKDVYNSEKKKNEKVSDKSTILVYEKKDKFGREKLWDFKESYHLRISKAYPTEGDIIIKDARDTDIQITDVISSISATSERTSFSTPTFFDPQGKYWIEFYEEIDLSKSRISADKLNKTGYGEKCKAENAYYEGEADCEKVTDKKKIYLTFTDGKINNSDTLKVSLNEIVNASGLKINPSPITENINVIPDLKVLRTIPENKAGNSDLTEFVMCTTTPLKVPAAEDVASLIKMNLDYEFRYWQRPVRVPDDNARYYKCRPGEFQNVIAYGLMPESGYSTEIKVTDHFDKNKTVKTDFKTGKMPEYYLNFYHYQSRYNVTTPDKTKLTYAAENMDYVNLNICKLDSKSMLHYLENYPSYTDAPQTITGCKQVVEKKIELPKKYWLKNYLQINLKDYVDDPLGHYLLTFSNPDYRERWGSNRQVYERTFLTVTNLGVVEKKVEVHDNPYSTDNNLSDKQKSGLKNVYWVTDLKSTNPIKGAKIQFFQSEQRYSGNSILKEVSSVVTNDSGVAEAPTINNLNSIIVTSGNDSTMMTDENYSQKFQHGSTATSMQKIYIYTDRPIYRPGNEVFIKGLYRIGYDSNYEVFNKEKVQVTAYNSKEEEIFNQEVEVDEFGTFNLKLVLDEKSPLGRYRVDAKNNNAYFEVEEYVPAPFKVDVSSDKEEYVSGDTLNMNVDASYYFGAPVEGGEVEYSIATQNYYFDKYQDEYFDFGTPWYYCWDDCDYGDKFILRNKASLDSSGKAKISQNLDLDKWFKDKERKSKIFAVYITVKNSSGQAVSSQKSFIVHNGEYYIGLKTDKYFLGKSEQFNVKAKSVDTKGKALAANNIDLKINKADWVQSKRKEVDGGYYYQWEKRLDMVQEKKISTDSNGNWNGNFFLKDEGEYEITATSTDGKGNAIAANYDVYVYGEAHVDVRKSNDENLEVVVEKSGLKAGDEASIIIKSPYDKAKALVSIERGKIFKYEIVDVNQNLYKYSFPVKDEYIPNFYVSVILISPNPEVKYGKVDFTVDTEKKNLNVSAKANKTSYLPGEEVTLDLEVKDYQDKPVETELSVAVVDLSVLALKGNPKKNPLVFFYGGFPLTVSTASNLRNILYEVDVPNETKGGSGGGSEPGDLAKKKRGLFKDTAFWEAAVKTNANGRAQLKFTLPDNLTTWQVETVGISKDTKLGVNYQEFLARKDVMLVPLKPRFVVPGDEFSIGAKVFNQTEGNQDLDISFLSQTLPLRNDKDRKRLRLKPGESQTVYFNAQADPKEQDGVYKFVLSAQNEKYNDTVENTIKITRNDTYETTATSGYSKESVVDEFAYLPSNVVKDRGELTIKSSATLAVFLSDALNYLLSYPYGCSEQIASKLDSIAIVKRGLNLKNIGDKFQVKDIEFDGQKYTIDEVVDVGLARLYLNQKSDGGFAYYPEGRSNFYLTLHVANSLKNVKDAGYAVNENTFRSAFSYINNTLSYDKEMQKNKDLVILAVYSLSKIKEYGTINNNLVAYVKGLNNDELFLKENISNTSLATLALLITENPKVYDAKYKTKVFDTLENRVDIDSRGAFLPAKGNFIWQFYETPVKDTALYLKALVKDKRDNDILDRILRWILRSRSKDGAWGSTNNTVSVIDALTDYLSWQKENESDFVLKTLLNGEEKASYDYNPKTILDQHSFKIPVEQLEQGVINTLEFSKENRGKLNNNFYYDIALKYYLPIDKIPPRDEGFTITREFFTLDDKKYENPVTEAKVGEVLKGHIKLYVPTPRNFIAIEDFIPAGVELVNFNLSTSDQSLKENDETNDNPYGYCGGWGEDYSDCMKHPRPDVQEFRDDRMFLFKEYLPEGEYEFDYYVRALVPGTFHHLPAVASEMYFPENFGRTRGDYFTVK